MTTINTLNKKTDVNLFTSTQVYAMEQAWFDQGNASFALMQQAAWQIAQHILQHHEDWQRAHIWIGQGNNGGDGWLVAMYLQQAGRQVFVTTVGLDAIDKRHAQKICERQVPTDMSDALKAQFMAVASGCSYQRFEDVAQIESRDTWSQNQAKIPMAEVYIDALFGIGLDRAPEGIYKQAIETFNQMAARDRAYVVAIDVPSGLVASTGQVFERCAIRADTTLCLVARKLGLHTKDGMDYTGDVKDVALIPYEDKPAATLLRSAYRLRGRSKNSYKGSYGHVLVIGGNRIDGSQGMGGAAILAATSAMAAGAGKITVACHDAFYGALLTSLPDAMTLDLHDKKGVTALIKEASVIAIGMGLGRDDTAKALFVTYVQAAMQQDKALVIDADGLYHLATLKADNHELINQLRAYSQEHRVCLTPHSGEAARLLDKKVSSIEADRLAAMTQCHEAFGGDWVLKGAGTLIWENAQVYVCSTGNAGMASAGMGDVLSGLIVGLMAQQDLSEDAHSLRQAVVIHGLAGDIQVNLPSTSMQIGQRGLQAQDMPVAIRHVMAFLTE